MDVRNVDGPMVSVDVCSAEARGFKERFGAQIGPPFPAAAKGGASEMATNRDLLLVVLDVVPGLPASRGALLFLLIAIS